MPTTSIDPSRPTVKVQAGLHNAQRDFFLGDPDVRFKILHKGRRWGFTQGAIHYALACMMGKIKKPNGEPYRRILWGDTVNNNIDRYVERYALPVLRQLPRHVWAWRKVQKELRINTEDGEWATMDFRSADRPENWEGFGYDLIILNEAGIILKNVYLYENALLPMIMDYQSPMIVGGTPKGKKDKKRKRDYGKEYSVFYELAQRGLERLPDGQPNPNYNPRYKTYIYTSYDNDLLEPEEIDALAAELPSVVREQEIYGKFIDEILGDVFQRDWWKFYDLSSIPDRAAFEKIIVSWDTAFKDGQENDYSVGTVWGVTANGVYLLDMIRDRMKFPDLKKAAIMLSETWGADWTLIEDKASGQSLADELEDGTRFEVKRVKADKDKVARATANTPTIESGRVFLPDTIWRPWAADFIEEHSEFPNGEYDDVVDSTAQALGFIKRELKKASSSVRVRRL